MCGVGAIVRLLEWTYRVAPENEEWISAAQAVALLQPSLGTFETRRTIASRAADSLIRSRARRFIRESPSDRRKKVEDNIELPAEFWWARGATALNQNWNTGDFDTWIQNTHHWRAFGVMFLKSDIDTLVATLLPPVSAAAASKVVNSANRKIFIVHGRKHGPREA